MIFQALGKLVSYSPCSFIALTLPSALQPGCVSPSFPAPESPSLYSRCLGLGVGGGEKLQKFFQSGLNFKGGASLVAQLVKNPHEMQETWVRSLGWEDPLEKGMATHSSILALRVPWTI